MMKTSSRTGKRFLPWLLLMATSLLITVPASAQQPSPITEIQVSHVFGSEIEFIAKITPETKIAQAHLTFQPSSGGQSIVLPVKFGVAGLLTARYEFSTQNVLPAFSRLTYWFTLEFADGSQIESKKASYLFTDNRFEWQTYSLSTNIDISWVEGDISLAQSVADAIDQHKTNFHNHLDLPFPEELHIYIYPTLKSLRSALEISQIPWASGHANLDQDTILVAIPSGFDQQLDIQRQIPHEITHIQLGLYLGGSTDPLPTWFNEGLASLAENFTVPEYWQILRTAYQNDNLIPLETLCESFPYTSDDAALAYAESESFVRYLNEEYGKRGLQALLDAYQNGETCQNGVQVALDNSLERLEADWYKDTFDSGMVPRSVGAILAWVALLAILFAAPIIMIVVSSQRKGGTE